MKRFIAFSLGVESTTMCLLYGKGATAIFTDTGSEHKELYARLALVEGILKAVHSGDFELKVIKPTTVAKGIVCHSLQEEIEASKFMPSGQARWCTRKWKIEPMDAFLESQGECELLIGLNADEEPGVDRTGNLMRCKNVHYRYPLYDEGYTRDDCKSLLAAHDLAPNYPVYMARGGCKFCPFKSKKEYKAMYYLDRPTFEEGRSMEHGIQDKRTVFFAICQSGQSFDEIAAECEKENGLFTDEQVRLTYKQVENGNSCGAFCHRQPLPLLVATPAMKDFRTAQQNKQWWLDRADEYSRYAERCQSKDLKTKWQGKAAAALDKAESYLSHAAN